MKPIFLALMLATSVNAGDGRQCSGGERDADVTPLFDKCVTLADEPTFEFPISRAIGVDLEYRFEPPQMPEQRSFSFTIAVTR